MSSDAVVYWAVLVYLLSALGLRWRLSRLEYPDGRKALGRSLALFAAWFLLLHIMPFLVVILILVISGGVLAPLAWAPAQQWRRPVLTVGLFWLHIALLFGFMVVVQSLPFK